MFNFLKRFLPAKEKREEDKKITVEFDGKKFEGFKNLSQFLNKIAHERDFKIDFDLYNRTARVVFAQDEPAEQVSKKKNKNKENK